MFVEMKTMNSVNEFRTREAVSLRGIHTKEKPRQTNRGQKYVLKVFNQNTETEVFIPYAVTISVLFTVIEKNLAFFKIYITIGSISAPGAKVNIFVRADFSRHVHGVIVPDLRRIACHSKDPH